jgi:hypothetical protein
MTAACCHLRSQERSVFERRASYDEERYENPSLTTKISNLENLEKAGVCEHKKNLATRA